MPYIASCERGCETEVDGRVPFCPECGGAVEIDILDWDDAYMAGAA